MKVYVIYKDQTDYAREVMDYLADFRRVTGHDLETIDPETPAGTQFCSTYDVIEYPTILATSDDGVMQNMWRGTPLPQISEVSYYVQ